MINDSTRQLSEKPSAHPGFGEGQKVLDAKRKLADIMTPQRAQQRIIEMIYRDPEHKIKGNKETLASRLKFKETPNGFKVFFEPPRTADDEYLLSELEKRESTMYRTMGYQTRREREKADNSSFDQLALYVEKTA